MKPTGSLCPVDKGKIKVTSLKEKRLRGRNTDCMTRTKTLKTELPKWQLCHGGLPLWKRKSSKKNSWMTTTLTSDFTDVRTGPSFITVKRYFFTRKKNNKKEI